MEFSLNKRSIENLRGVHTDLVLVMQTAIERSPFEFMVIEGLRTEARQKKLVAAGASKTMNSRHLTGHAVDIVPLLDGEIRWDWELYHKLSPVIKKAALDVGASIVWGGDWKTFKDGPHWELDRKRYP